MRPFVARSAVLLGCALLAPVARADVVPDPTTPRTPDAASAEPRAGATVQVIVVVGGLVLAGILIALLYRRRDARPAVHP